MKYLGRFYSSFINCRIIIISFSQNVLHTVVLKAWWAKSEVAKLALLHTGQQNMCVHLLHFLLLRYQMESHSAAGWRMTGGKWSSTTTAKGMRTTRISKSCIRERFGLRKLAPLVFLFASRCIPISLSGLAPAICGVGAGRSGARYAQSGPPLHSTQTHITAHVDHLARHFCPKSRGVAKFAILSLGLPRSLRS